MSSARRIRSGAVRERAPHQPRFDSGSEMGRLPCVESAVPCVPPSGLVHAGAVMDRHPAGPMQIVPRYPAAPFDPHGPCLSLLSSVKGAERPAQFGGIDGLDSLAVYATHEIALCPKLAAAPLAVLFRHVRSSKRCSSSESSPASAPSLGSP